MSRDHPAEVADLAQVRSEHVNDLNWENLCRAVVCHLAGLPAETAVIIPRVRPTDVCHNLLVRYSGCDGWRKEDACEHMWHPEFIQILVQDKPTWVWVLRLIVCRQHQRALGINPRHNQGQLTCTDPNCTRPHAPDWYRAELLAFHWLVKHNCMQGLEVGFASDGSLIHMSHESHTHTSQTDLGGHALLGRGLLPPVQMV